MSLATVKITTFVCRGLFLGTLFEKRVRGLPKTFRNQKEKETVCFSLIRKPYDLFFHCRWIFIFISAKISSTAHFIPQSGGSVKPPSERRKARKRHGCLLALRFIFISAKFSSTAYFCCQKPWHNEASIREGGGPRSGGRSLRERIFLDKVRISRTNFVDQFGFPHPRWGDALFACNLRKNHNLGPFLLAKAVAQ